MSDYNKIVLTGKIHESKMTENGAMKFTLINEDGYGEKKKTYWFKCTAFKKTAEFINNYMPDKTNVILDGKCTISKYQDKFYTEILVNNIQFNGKNSKTPNGNQKDGDFGY